jgi:hypothetical protein
VSGDGERLWCRRCEQTYPATSPYCPQHPGEELVPAPAVGADDWPDPVAADPAAQRQTCWKCGTRAENLTNDACAQCHESLVPPWLLIRFPRGLVLLRKCGTSAELGRAGMFSGVFGTYPNVSRQHATVSVDQAGDAWITPNPAAPNGTFVNNVEILQRTQLHPGDQLRLAGNQPPNFGPESEEIRQPQREPAR